jgi:hypothetical protein
MIMATLGETSMLAMEEIATPPAIVERAMSKMRKRSWFKKADMTYADTAPEMRASRVFTWEKNVSDTKGALSVQGNGRGGYHNCAACACGGHESVEGRERQPHHNASNHREDVTAMELESR